MTVTLPSGETVTGRLLGVNDFNVALRDENDGFRSFTRKDENNPKVEIHDPLKVHTDMLKTYTDENIHNLTAYTGYPEMKINRFLLASALALLL